MMIFFFFLKFFFLLLCSVFFLFDLLQRLKMEFLTNVPTKHPFTAAAIAVALVALFWNILRGKKALHLQGSYIVKQQRITNLEA